MIRRFKYYYDTGKNFLQNKYIVEGSKLNQIETKKNIKRFDIINYLISVLNRNTTYLEIGVRNPNDNFDKIHADVKYSVDPGLEFAENPVDFKMISDDFFNHLRNGQILDKTLKFDIIFIDGLHLAEQVEKDINNALEFIKDDGYIILHDCNPPTEWHAREEYYFNLSPAKGNWNGTTWKAFLKARYRNDISSCCIDTDWGVGIISKQKKLGEIPEIINEFYEFHVLNKHRKNLLNLITFEELNSLMSSQ